MRSERVDFPGSSGAQLAARLDLPEGPVRAAALIAHCFTCSKDIPAIRRIARRLAAHGIAVMRFDFTGLVTDLVGAGGDRDSARRMKGLKRAAYGLRPSRFFAIVRAAQECGERSCRMRNR